MTLPADIRHVVILMQENRSFDHYLGTLRGVRGFDDKQALTFPDGSSVFRQPDRSRTDQRLLPWHMDAGITSAQHGDELPHDWETGHQAIARGAMNAWVGAKGPATMGYFTRADIPYQYALADEFTICDAYFCSLAGPTSPNRLYLWSGTAGPGIDGTSGPWPDNTPLRENPVCDWTTYAERLEAADVSWRVYNTPGMDEEHGNYGDNALEYFVQFQSDGPLRDKACADAGLDAFDADCRNGSLPTVSWLVAPYNYCEHPAASPARGASWVDAALQSVFANPDVWQHTVFLLMYDENDGFFDHMVPPTPPAGTVNEFIDGQPIGLGNRVPLWVISPWSRGGWVNSQVLDHTSVLRFLELVTGVVEPNISQWRRAVCGDLTTCFDFSTPDYSVPQLPDTANLVARADAAAAFTAPAPPAPFAQAPTSQEPGERPRRVLPYRPWADVVVGDDVVCRMRNDGAVSFPFTVYPYVAKPFAGTPFTVAPGETAEYQWQLAATWGRYDFAVYGPDGFVARFAGTKDDELRVVATLGDVLEISLTNDRADAVEFTVEANDFGGSDHHVLVQPAQTETITWPAVGGYDVVITAGSLLRRFAGRGASEGALFGVAAPFEAENAWAEPAHGIGPTGH